MFQRVERLPFQMAMARDHQRRFSRALIQNYVNQDSIPEAFPAKLDGTKRDLRMLRAAAPSRHRPRYAAVGLLLHIADEFEQLHRMRAKLFGELVLDRLGVGHEARLVDVLDNLDAQTFKFHS